LRNNRVAEIHPCCVAYNSKLTQQTETIQSTINYGFDKKKKNLLVTTSHDRLLNRI
jgi:hypothetical protein